MKFLPTDKFTEFWTKREIDIQKLDNEIRLALGAKRWEDNPTKEGFSGITIGEDVNWKENKKKAKYRVIVHWTLDGETGFNIEFPANIKGTLESVINKHTADNLPEPISLI